MVIREAIRDDLRFASRISEGERCSFCSGTGNELYGMFKSCRACGGDGVSKGNEEELREAEKSERLARQICGKCGQHATRWSRMDDSGRIRSGLPGRYFCKDWPNCG